MPDAVFSAFYILQLVLSVSALCWLLVVRTIEKEKSKMSGVKYRPNDSKIYLPFWMMLFVGSALSVAADRYFGKMSKLNILCLGISSMMVEHMLMGIIRNRKQAVADPYDETEGDDPDEMDDSDDL